MHYSIHTWLMVPACLYLISFIAIVFKKEAFSFLLVLTGFFTYTIYLCLRLFIPGQCYLQSAFDSVFLTPWTIALTIILLYLYYRNGTLLYASFVLIICVALALIYPKGILPPSPHKLSYLAYCFFLFESAGIGLFYIGGCYALMYCSTLNNNNFKYFYQCIILGFLFYSAAQFVGAMWCYRGWGVYFKWSPRHLQSVLVWIVYINCIHLKYIPYFNKQKISVYGFISALLTLYLYFCSYLHEYNFPRIGN
ncbi:MAG: hypothetical protein WHV26_00470 [Spirochaetota bacterium]